MTNIRLHFESIDDRDLFLKRLRKLLPKGKPSPIPGFSKFPRNAAQLSSWRVFMEDVTLDFGNTGKGSRKP